jgi:hypothetical protein
MADERPISNWSIRGMERRAHALHRVESEGESQWTPLLATIGISVVIFVLLVVLLAIAFAAYYVS